MPKVREPFIRASTHKCRLSTPLRRLGSSSRRECTRTSCSVRRRRASSYFFLFRAATDGSGDRLLARLARLDALVEALVLKEGGPGIRHDRCDHTELLRAVWCRRDRHRRRTFTFCAPGDSTCTCDSMASVIRVRRAHVRMLAGVKQSCPPEPSSLPIDSFL